MAVLPTSKSQQYWREIADQFSAATDEVVVWE
jgi:hypothetical protein